MFDTPITHLYVMIVSFNINDVIASILSFLFMLKPLKMIKQGIMGDEESGSNVLEVEGPDLDVMETML